METKTETSSTLDTVKLLFAALLLVAGLGSYYYYTDQSILVRVGGVLVATVLALVVFMQTELGRNLWHFMLGARIELNKMVWPSRPETVQTTMAVIFFAILLGVFFFFLDMLLGWATRMLTGQGG